MKKALRIFIISVLTATLWGTYGSFAQSPSCTCEGSNDHNGTH